MRKRDKEMRNWERKLRELQEGPPAEWQAGPATATAAASSYPPHLHLCKH